MAKGKLEVVCGSMFSGKSEELIRRLRRAQIAQLKVQVFKHSLDNQRAMTEYVQAHNGDRILALATDSIVSIQELVMAETQVIGIDEIQFFAPEIVTLVQELIERGKLVIVAGLDMDFRGLPFGVMPTLMALADEVTKLKAVCISCGNDAHFTQRLVNGQPAKLSDPLIVIGAQECYQARCRACYKIDGRLSELHKHL